MDQTNKCNCLHNILLLNSTKKYQPKQIRRAHKRIHKLISRHKLDNKTSLIMDTAAKAISNGETSIMMEHNCEDTSKIVATIKKSIEAGAENTETQFKKELEEIRGHYYKREIIKFTMKWKGYEITTFETADQAAEWPLQLRIYLRSLGNKARNTILRRNPALAEALRE